MSAPWMKFYPTDWRADPALRMCSLASRGLWMEMLCVMHEAEPYGSLRVNGKPLSERQLAVLSGASMDECASLLSELEESGVFSRDDSGVIVSRRMQRDKAKADSDKANGKRGGNPTLTLSKGVNPPVKGGDKAQIPEARYQIEDVDANASTSPEPEKSAPASPSVFDLPCTSGEIFPVTEADVSEWREAFPAVDVRQQLAAMRAWLHANPKRAKTRRGMKRFAVSWLDRQQNKAPAPRAASPPPRQTVGQQARDELRRMGFSNVTDTETRYRDESDGSPDIAGDGIARRVAFAAGGR